MAFTGIKPASQPRSLRSITESHGASSVGRTPGIGEESYNPQAGVPTYVVGGANNYQDVAEAAKPSPAFALRQEAASAPKPFSNR